jgi:hypothetical protein
MKIDEVIKAVFEGEVDGNRSVISPLQNYSPGGSGEKTVTENRRSRLAEAGFAVCFIVILGISVLLKDGFFRSPLANQGASIARLFPEDPKEALYNFIFAIRSSF